VKESHVNHSDSGEIKQKDEHFPVNNFQDLVNNLLIRHKSILDCLTKFQESTARVNRAIAKTVTWCGCINIKAGRQQLPEDISLPSIKDYQKYLETHLEGSLCMNCQEVIEEELGNHLFYLAALCNLLGLDLRDTLDQELSRLNTLGHFHLS